MSAKRHTEHRRAFRRKLLVVAVSSCVVADASFANPTGPSVAHGQATFSSIGSNLTVTNTPGTVINWQGFSIAASEGVRFNQQSASSSVLNRVVGVNPSSILGTLQSNGRVFLVNPNGITIGPGANIDVAGFVASTLSYSDSNFLAGQLKFSSNADVGSVVNQGVIKTASGGMVYLIGQDVQNSGIIHSPKGEIILAAGKSVELVDAQTPEVRVQLTAPDNQALNLGQLIAAGGNIGMYGAMVKHSGVASANTAVMGENGKIVFRAVKDVTLAAGSVASASGPEGGRVTAQAETGTLIAAGTIEAKGEAGQGGAVQLMGTQVGLVGSAQVDTSGEAGGGTVLVGGDFQGRNAEVQNAQRTFVGSDVRIAANAVTSGSGGKVVVWADGDARYHGQITARGGAQSGDGGFVEVSGKEVLNFYGGVDVGAPSGRSGTILLDPRDITVADTVTGGGDNAQVSDGSILFADGATANTNFTISDEALEALSGNIILQASRDITLNSGLSGGGLVLTNQTGANRVVLQAGRHVLVNSNLITYGAPIWLEADSPHSNGYPATAGTVGSDGAGAVRIGTGVVVRSFNTDAATGGKITMIGGSNSKGGTNGGGFDLNGDVNAGAGGIDVALSSEAVGELSFLIGSSGQAQFTSTDTGQLKSTGQLKIGEATTAGSDGLGPGGLNDQITIKVDRISIGETAGGPVDLASDAGTSLMFTAGDGGIRVARDLSTNQTTSINTTGPLTIEAPLDTNGSTLNISAASVSGAGNIAPGTTINCTGTGCPGATIITWDGGGGDLNWFTANNWSGNVVPTSSDAVEVLSSTGTILISGDAAVAKSLIADVPFSISNTGSLSLVEGSQFTRTLTLQGSLLGNGAVSVSGSSGVLSWNTNGSTMGSGGLFTLGVGSSGTLSGSLVLNRNFQNSAALTLSGASISGTGTLTNSATMTAAAGTSNTVSTAFTNDQAGSLIQVLGTLVASNLTNQGVISVGNDGAFGTAGNALTNTTSSSVHIDAGNFSTTAGNSVVTDVSGNLSVTGSLSAGSIKLLAGGSGGVILNSGGNLTATGSASDSIVVSGATFTNNAGSGVLVPGSGRWLIYSADPAGNTFGGLASGNKAIWGVSYPAAVSDTGNRYVFSDPGAVTVTTTNANKTYGDAAIDLSANYALTGKPVNALAYGDVYLNSTVSDIFFSGPAIASTGNTATAAVGGGGGAGGAYAITASGVANTGYGLTFVDSGLLTIDPRAITVKAADQSRAYGDANPTTGGFTLEAGTLVNGDTIGSVNVSSAATGTSNAGTTHALSNDGSNFTSGLSSNYSITAQNGVLTIGQRAITVKAADQSRAYGDANPMTGGFTLEAGTLVNGDTIGSVNVSSAATGTSNAGTTHALSNDGSNFTSGLSSNYSITAQNGVLTIDKRAITVTADAKSKTYGDADPALTYTTSSLGAGIPVSGSLTRIAGEAVADGPYAILQGGVTNVNNTNYDITYVGANLDILKRAITLAANTAGKAYGSADPALSVSITGGSLGSVSVSDTLADVTGTVSRQAGETVLGGPYDIVLGSGAKAGNYVITFVTDNNAFTISPAVISLAGNRAYDGSVNFGPGTFGTINGVNGETLTVAGGGNGTVPSPKVLAGTQSLNPGTLTLADGSGQASNYTLTGGTHTGTITATASVPFAWDIAGAADLNWENPANWNQGAVPMNGAMASIPGGLAGAVVYSGAIGVTSLKTLSSGSGFTISGGTLTLGNSSADVSTFSGGALTVNGGTLNGPGTISLAGVTLDVLAGGVLGGSRTIIGNVNNAAGTVSPGTSPGIMTIDGNYTQGASGVLRAEVSGLVPGTGYDQLVVTGTTTLAGVLDVSLVNGFVPADGNTFSIIQSGGSVTGTFTQANLPANPVMSLNYLVSSVELASSQQVNTEQLISVQVDSTNNSSPNTDLLPVSTTSNTVTSGDLNLANTYLDAGGGQIVPLSSTNTVDPGVYVNVATGETTILQSGTLPEPGVYLSADQKTVIAVTIDPETGRLVLMTGEVGSATGVGATAKVQKPGVCR